MSAGVAGTLELLFRCRDELGTLPRISQRLGKVVRTNSEAIVSALSPDVDEDLTHGAAISSHFYVGDHTHITQSLGNASVTAHILGGCAIGSGPEDGVIDIDHQVFGHPVLFVSDASAIPANVGVNPSLTITALAERFSSRFPPKTG